MRKMTRAEIKSALEEMPDSMLLGATVSKELTPKQRAFAREVAKGKTKAQAYRDTYKPNATRATISSEPYAVASDPRVAREIAAYQAAMRAAEYRTPAHLRELVIQSLVEVMLREDAKPSEITAAAKVLGTVTEVAAFTERKEVRTIKTTDEARAHVLGQLRELVQAQATDAAMVDDGADSLLAELTGGQLATDTSSGDDETENRPDETPPAPNPPDA